MEDTEDPLDVDIDEDDLPYGWSVERTYDTRLTLDSPDGQAEQVLLQTWGGEQYLVEPMVGSDLPGADAESVSGLGGTESTLEDAKAEAIRIARLIA